MEKYLWLRFLRSKAFQVTAIASKGTAFSKPSFCIQIKVKMVNILLQKRVNFVVKFALEQNYCNCLGSKIILFVTTKSASLGFRQL